MKSYGKKSYLKKNFALESENNSEKNSGINIQLIHQIINTINISLIVLIFTFFSLSLDSQRKWTNVYKTLSKTKTMNNNLIDYISKTEEFYISELESLNTYRKTKPKDLIYLDKIEEKKESFFEKSFISLLEGIKNSEYQRGY